MKSNLPPIENQFIGIKTLSLTDYVIPTQPLAVEFKPVGAGEWASVVPSKLYHIDHPELRSYIPSKVFAKDEQFTFLYYTNDTLPDAVRPFGDGGCYVWWMEFGTTLEYRYPANVRVMIDQVTDRSSGDVYIVLIASAEEFDKLRINKVPKHKIE